MDLGALSGGLGCCPLVDGTCLPPTGSRALGLPAFGVWSEGNPIARASSIQWLYLRQRTHEAIPKDVSGRTSYYPARLEFHHEPHLIRGRFNERRCGPPQGFTPASSWTWLDRRVSGADTRTQAPCSGSLSLRLRVFPLVLRVCTDSQAHSSIGTASGFNALRHLVSARFQDLFHSPPGVLFTFPSRYLFAIGSRTVFSLAGRSPRLRSGFHVSRLTLSC